MRRYQHRLDRDLDAALEVFFLFPDALGQLHKSLDFFGSWRAPISPPDEAAQNLTRTPLLLSGSWFANKDPLMRFWHWFWFSDGRWRKHFQVIDHQVAVAAFGRVWILEVDVIVQIRGRKLLLAGWHAEARFVNGRPGLDGGDIEAFDFFAVDGESHSGGLRSGLLAISPR